MINLDTLSAFIRNHYEGFHFYLDRSREDVLLAEIDCLEGERKLAIRGTYDKVEFSTISKDPELNFSFYDYSVKSQQKAEELLLRIKKKNKFLFPEE